MRHSPVLVSTFPKTLVLVTVCALGLQADTLTLGGPGDSGNGLTAPFGDGSISSEYQQIYDSSLFPGVSGPITINSLTFADTYNAFGLADQINGASALTYTITFSTTTETVSNFLNNSASGLQPISTATLFFSSTGCPFQGVNAFCDITNPTAGFTIQSNQNSFVYDPTAGNLVMDIIKSSTDPTLSPGLTLGLDVNDTSTLMAAAFSDTSNGLPPCSSGCSMSGGLVTQFGFTSGSPSPSVPEPSQYWLTEVVIGAMVLGAAYRKQKCAASIS